MRAKTCKQPPKYSSWVVFERSLVSPLRTTKFQTPVPKFNFQLIGGHETIILETKQVSAPGGFRLGEHCVARNPLPGVSQQILTFKILTGLQSQPLNRRELEMAAGRF